MRAMLQSQSSAAFRETRSKWWRLATGLATAAAVCALAWPVLAQTANEVFVELTLMNRYATDADEIVNQTLPGIDPGSSTSSTMSTTPPHQ